jgi:hypothetical protein
MQGNNNNDSTRSMTPLFVYQLIFQVVLLVHKLEDVFLTDSLMSYIKRKIATKYSTNSIIEGFHNLKERQVPF